MKPIYDRYGKVIGWLQDNRILNRQGQTRYVINGENVFDNSGRFSGRWASGHWRGKDGGVVAWAQGAQSLGVIPPIPSIPPIPPIPSIPPIPAIPQIPPIPRIPKMGWSSDSYLED